MPTEDIAIGLLRDIDTQNWPAVSAAFDTGAAYRPPGQQPRIGRAAIERYYRDERPVRRGLHRVGEIMSRAGLTIVTGEFVGANDSGAVACASFIDILRIEGGLIRDREVLTRPLGARPQEPPLETERLLLRPFDLADASAVARIAGSRHVADTTISVPHPLTPESTEDWIIGDLARCARSQNLYAAVERNSGALIGSVGFRHIDATHRQAELTFWFDSARAGAGFATEAAGALVTRGFSQLGLARIEAYFMRRNPASGRVLAKLGFHREAVLARRIVKWDVPEDVELWTLLR